eukprot:scaffold249795_cov36-Tisochrysis_lutea.AAC.1
MERAPLPSSPTHWHPPRHAGRSVHDRGRATEAEASSRRSHDKIPRSARPHEPRPAPPPNDPAPSKANMATPETEQAAQQHMRTRVTRKRHPSYHQPSQ